SQFRRSNPLKLPMGFRLLEGNTGRGPWQAGGRSQADYTCRVRTQRGSRHWQGCAHGAGGKAPSTSSREKCLLDRSLMPYGAGPLDPHKAAANVALPKEALCQIKRKAARWPLRGLSSTQAAWDATLIACPQTQAWTFLGKSGTLWSTHFANWTRGSTPCQPSSASF